jgi:SpoVK/Ycf46/Vps4 family AAA+-type ATPase
MSWQLQHLQLRLRPIHRALAALASQQPSSLRTLDALLSSGRTGLPRCRLEEDECAEEQHIRTRAKASKIALPLDVLADELELDPFELEVIVLCAAVELDPAYGRVLAEIQRDTILRRPTIGLATVLTASTLAERVERRSKLGRLGRLRRLGLVQAATTLAESDAELVLTSEALAVLLGHARHRFSDRCDVPTRAANLALRTELAPFAERARSANAMTVAVWGGSTDTRREAARALARELRRPLRQIADPVRLAQDPAGVLDGAAADACALEAALWLDLDRLSLPEDTITAVLESSPALLIITARQSTRPPRLVARGFVECQLATPSFADRRAMWRDAVPDLPDAQADMLAGRYRLDQTAIVAAATLARTTRPDAMIEVLDEAAASISQPRSLRFADVIAPQRKFEALVLPPPEERQVRELAETYLVWPRVAERWGFATSNAVGVKALFTGEPGTGKTLAAEVIAGHLGLSLVRIDLARIVSKWVGETEKNLDAAFVEAEESSAVLFFDEAEALFGKRGEVRHGTDRYANLEVSFLLQRFERHDGLVILASNLRDEIDPAFVRRFQHVVHFPRPAEFERRRLWRLAFPSAAPLAGDVDLAVLARLDMTGAAITSTARVAALNAARVGADTIGVDHIVDALTSQYHREARALTATDLGPYASALRRQHVRSA